MIQIDLTFIEERLREVEVSDCKQQNYDLRTFDSDTSQLILNALLSSTVAPIYHHTNTTETVV